MLDDQYGDIAQGLVQLHQMCGYADAVPRKLQSMEQNYVSKNSELYSEPDLARLKYYRQAFSFKFRLAIMHLEQLQALARGMHGDIPLRDVLHLSLDAHELDDAKALLYTFCFESFIVQGFAFLDFYTLYLWFFFKAPQKKIPFKLQDRVEALEGLPEPYHDRGEAVKNYLDTEVFSDGTATVFLTNNWGSVLQDLRHKMVHRDRSAPDIAQQVSLLSQVTSGWPQSLQDIQCARFCQYAQNEMFYMVTKLAALLYQLDWQPGQYFSEESA